jgi:hypothetical protein
LQFGLSRTNYNNDKVERVDFAAIKHQKPRRYPPKTGLMTRCPTGGKQQ